MLTGASALVTLRHTNLPAVLTQAFIYSQEEPPFADLIFYCQGGIVKTSQWFFMKTSGFLDTIFRGCRHRCVCEVEDDFDGNFRSPPHVSMSLAEVDVSVAEAMVKFLCEGEIMIESEKMYGEINRLFTSLGIFIPSVVVDKLSCQDRTSLPDLTGPILGDVPSEHEWLDEEDEFANGDEGCASAPVRGKFLPSYGVELPEEPSDVDEKPVIEFRHECWDCPKKFYFMHTLKKHREEYHGDEDVDFNSGQFEFAGTSYDDKDYENEDDDEDQDEDYFEVSERASARVGKIIIQHIWSCPNCHKTCSTPSIFREHLSLKHYKDSLEQKFMTADRKCGMCGYNGSSIARHIGSVHKLVDSFLTEEEANALNEGAIEPGIRDRAREGRTPGKRTRKQIKMKEKSPLQTDKKPSKKDNECLKERKEPNLRSRWAAQNMTNAGESLLLTCCVCDRKLATRGSLKKHIVVHFKDQIMNKYGITKAAVCPLCTKVCSSKCYAIEHVGVHHGKIGDFMEDSVYAQLFN